MRIAAILLLAASPAFAQAPKDPEGWAQHDLNRPQPTVVDPGTGVPPQAAGQPPADAVVLFGGKDLSAWKSSKDGAAAPWKVEGGTFEVVPKAGGIETKQGFGDVQLHIEWMAPDPAKGEGQDRGNSGVFFGGGRYEIQVLDNYGNKTYPDGQAGSPVRPVPAARRTPAVRRASGRPTTSSSRRPASTPSGKLTKPARVTVFHNGVLVQHATEFIGPATNKVRTPYTAHPEKLPIGLQDHNHPVRFRNVWLRELKPRP